MHLFLDGFETSSIAITNALYEVKYNYSYQWRKLFLQLSSTSQLADNNEIQQKLRTEVEKCFEENGKINYEKLIDNEYLDQVLHESLRLHPPATILNRECTEPIEIEGVKGKKHQIKLGEGVMIPVYSIHRDPGEFELFLNFNGIT